MEEEITKVKKLYDFCNQTKNCTYPKAAKSENLEYSNHQKLTATEYLEIMDENYGSCETKSNPYYKIGNWLLTGELDYPGCNYKDDLLNNIEPI